MARSTIWWDFNQASGVGFLKEDRLDDAMAAKGYTSIYNAIKDNGVER